MVHHFIVIMSQYVIYIIIINNKGPDYMGDHGKKISVNIMYANNAQLDKYMIVWHICHY